MTANVKNYADVWKKIPWKSLEKSLYILQHRIYKATKNNNLVKVKKLQRLLIYSKASKFLAVKQITQLNSGKIIPGVNSIFSLSIRERLELANSIRIDPNEEDSMSYKIIVSKTNGETIRDRVRQCILKYALEPVYEAQTSCGSYGFRSGRNAHDIMINIQNNLTGIPKRILQINVKKCFDKIDHGKLLILVTLPDFAKKVLKKALISGLLPEKLETFERRQQGSVLSPLLADIMLCGLEDVHNDERRSHILHRGIRYVDDLVFFLKETENAETLFHKIQIFLNDRGLNVTSSNIRICKVIEGFDFLGWTFKVKPSSNKYLCYPDSKSMKNLIRNLKRILSDSKYSLEHRINRVKFVYREWLSYNKYCNLSKMNLWSIKHWSYEYIRNNSSFSRRKRFEIIQDIFAHS